MSNTVKQATSGYTKSVEFDKETRDFCAYVNGQIMGFAKTRLQAEQICDRYTYEALRRTHITAADLSPEDAADVLTALTQVDAEEQAKRAYAAALEAEAQAALETEEARVGVEETLPCSIYHQFAGITVEVEADGTAAVYLPDSGRVNLDAASTYELYLFFAKLPGVGPLLERLYFQRQAAEDTEYKREQLREAAIVRLMAELEPDARKRIEDSAYEQGRKAGQAQAVGYLKQVVTDQRAA